MTRRKVRGHDQAKTKCVFFKLTLSSVAVHFPFVIEVYLTASLIGNCSTLASYLVSKALAINLLVKVAGSGVDLEVTLAIFIVAFLIVEIINNC